MQHAPNHNYNSEYIAVQDNFLIEFELIVK